MNYLVSGAVRTLQCLRCQFSCQSAAKYCNHLAIHQMERNFKLRCPLCIFVSSSVKGLETHVNRDHKEEKRDEQPIQVPSMKCNICHCVESTAKKLVTHLANHITDGTVVDCPFGKCCDSSRASRWVTKFHSAKTFRDHFYRHHSKQPDSDAPPPKRFSAAPSSSTVPSPMHETSFDSAEPLSSSDTAEPVESPWTDGEIVKLIGNFYLKLEGELALPSSSVQTISESLSAILDVSRRTVKVKLCNAMKDAGVKEEVASKIAQLALSGDPFYRVHHKVLGSIALTSEHLRHKFFKENFNYRAPSTVALKDSTGHLLHDKFGKVKTVQMVSIQETLEVMLKDPSVQKCVDERFCNTPSDTAESQTQIYRDFTDGKLFKDHPGARENAFFLFLFQDGFGVTNPIGAAKNKHKTRGVYFSLGNLPPEKRSKVDLIKLFALIPEDHFKSEKDVFCWQPVISQLKDLEAKGVLYKGQVHKCYVMFILGDNLGQHQLGGYLTVFNQEDFCRFCDITKTEFREKPHIVKELRTPDHYDECVRKVDELSVLHYKGVKFNSSFNDLTQYHVSKPGLISCSAHDILEGITSYDLPLMLKYFLEEKKWTTREALNRNIKALKLTGMDSGDKPAFIEPGANKKIKMKLSGNAVQNWNFLRFLPFYIGHENICTEDPVWRLYLKQKHLCEVVFSPTLTGNDITILQVLASAYVSERQDLFRNVPLRPKHHYLLHYPLLTHLCGPLIRLMTLRMESKHSILKRAARLCQNFIDVNETMAIKHQLREAFNYTGPILNDTVVYSRSSASNTSIFENDVANYIHENLRMPSGAINVESVTYNSIIYCRFQSWLLLRIEEGCLIVGEVRGIFCLSETNIVLILKCYSTTRTQNEFGLHEVFLHDSRGIEHLSNLNEIESHYPLSLYMFGDKPCLSLKHGPAHCH